MTIRSQGGFVVGRSHDVQSRAGSIHGAFRDMRRFMGEYPDAAAQTRPVNMAFKKAANKYVTGVRSAYRSAGIKRITGSLYDAIQSKLGRAAFRPSAIVFVGGGRGSAHRNLVESDWTTKDGRHHKGTPYVKPGLEQANDGAVDALRSYIRTHMPAIIREANRIATRG